MKRVAIYLISDGIGGAEQVVWEIINGLGKSNSIYLIINNEIIFFYSGLLPADKILNIGDVFLNTHKKLRFVRFIFNNRFYSLIPLIIRLKSWKITNYLIANDIGIIHSHLDYSLYSSLQIKSRINGIKVFHTIHGAFGLIEDKQLKPSVPLSSIDFNSIDKLIFVSVYNYNLFKTKGIYINEYEIIYNGIENRYNGIYARQLRKNKDFEILYVGGCKYVKGYDILVETINLLKEFNLGRKFHVVVLGQLADGCNLLKMIKQKGIEHFFNLIGFVDPPGHLDYFISADILFMPSRSEALPIAAIEAVYFDLPVIASNVGGIPEVIKDGENGLLADGEPEKLALKIYKMCNDFDKYASKAHDTNKELRKKFSSINMCNMYMNLYKEDYEL